jgi:hypothetical protein
MAAPIGDLIVRVGADTTGLVKGVGQADGSLKKLGGSIASGGAALAAYAAAAAAAGAAIAAALVVKGLDAVDTQAKLARTLNTTSASMATLKRAGDLSGVSMDQISQAGKQLSINLGKAADGTGKQAEALNRLNLSADKLASLPLDERIMAVNSAIKAQIPAAEQAAVAAELFGARAAMSIGLLNPEGIADARRQTELFGKALSEVDAAKVEAANDAMSTFKMAAEGVSQQLAVKFAPILTAIGKLFEEATEKAGGIGPVTTRAFNMAIDAAAFLLDAVEGVKRVFDIAGRAIAVAMHGAVYAVLGVADAIINGPVWATNELINLLNKLPGVKIGNLGISGLGETIKAEMAIAAGAIAEGVADIADLVTAPLTTGDRFKKFVAEAEAAAEAAAQAAVAAGPKGFGGEGAEVEAAAATTEKIDKELQRRLESIRQANLTEIELLYEKQAAEHEALAAGWEQKLLTDEQYQAQVTAATQRHQEAIQAINQRAIDAQAKMDAQAAAAKQALLAKAWGGLTTLMNSGSRKLFETGKIAAIADAMVSTYQGMAASLKLGYPLGPPAAAAIGAAGFAQVANIRSQTFGGGGGAGAASTTAAVNAAAMPTTGGGDRTFTVQGLSAGSLFTGDSMRGLLEAIEEAAGDGRTRLVIA